MTLCLSFPFQIPSYQTSQHRYANVKSKIDQSDPNPAHKLQRSIEDLTVDSKQGREYNPRFSNQKFTRTRPLFHKQRTIGSYSEHYPSSVGAKKRSPLVERSASLDSPLTKPAQSKLASTFPGPVKRERASKFSTMSTLAENLSGHNVFEEIREEDEDLGAAVCSELSGSVSVRANSKAFTVNDVEEEDLLSSTVGVCGVEVTSSSTETTVVLQHILALTKNSSSALHGSDMDIIEEDEVEEEEYYESEDTPMSAKSPTVTFSLPHLIPRLIITDENQCLVETVVQTAKEYSASAFQYAISPFGLLEEEEEEIIVLATRL